MKKFIFTLERMLHYKETLYEKEKNALGQLRAEQNKLEARMEENSRQADDADGKLKNAAAQGTTLFELQSFHFQIENSRRLQKQFEQERTQLLVLIEKQMQVVLALSQEISGLEKLREKQKADYDYGVLRAQEETIGELVSSRYTRQQSGQSN